MFVAPALRRVREERGTHILDDSEEIKSLGHLAFLNPNGRRGGL
jgi:hypothetical protein